MSTNVVSVNANIWVEGTDFSPTKVKVQRNAPFMMGSAEIKGISDRPDTISEGDRIAVNIRSQGHGGRIFTGQVMRATINDKNVITINAYDCMHILQSKVVKYNSEERVLATEAIRQILGNVPELNLRSSDVDMDDVGPRDVFVARPESFIGGDVREDRVHGNAEGGKSLRQTIRDLCDKLGAVVWVDRYNALRIEPYPKLLDVQNVILSQDALGYYANNPLDQRPPATNEDLQERINEGYRESDPYSPTGDTIYTIPYIKEIKAGGETLKQNGVIVRGGGATGNLGPAASYTYSRVRPDSTVSYGDGEEPEEGINKVVPIEDQNITTQKGADKLAYSEQFNIAMDQRPGSIKAVGFPRVDLLDRIKVPQLTADDEGGFERPDYERDSYGPPYNAFGRTDPMFDLEDGPSVFSVAGITHIIDTNKGYTTELSLMPHPEDILSSMGIEYAEALEENMEYLDKKHRGPYFPGTMKRTIHPSAVERYRARNSAFYEPNTEELKPVPEPGSLQNDTENDQLSGTENVEL